MLEMFYQWIRNLAFYLVIATAVLEALPGDSYKKYVRFFAGMVTILLLLSPVLDLMGMKGHFTDIYHSKEYAQEKREIEKQRQYFEEMDQMNFLPEEYIETGGEDNKIEVGEIWIGSEVEGLSGSNEER